MNDTYVTIVGTALTRPERKALDKTNAVVASFRVIANTRRFDKMTQQWVDGPSLRIRVNCWRRLAENVAASIFVGDPVVVYGRISTKDWETAEGEARISFEVDADSVGHDLTRGTTSFVRTRSVGPVAVIEDDESERHINGELARSLADPGDPLVETPAGYDGDAYAILRDVGYDAGGPDSGSPDSGDDDELDDDDEEELVGATTGSGGSGARGRRRGR
jgi:single-strand DNA-binding protein